MSIYQPFVILPNVKIFDRKKGGINFRVSEKIGIAIVNPRALAKIQKSVVVGK